MKFKRVNYKSTDSLILSLENLTTEYNNVLNMYNQVQQELNTFANSTWTINPYLNQNIQFTTGEIAYVTINGSVYLYQFLQELQNNITNDQTWVNTSQTMVNNDETIVYNDQSTVTNDQNIVNNAQNSFNQATNQYYSTTASDGVQFANNMISGGVQFANNVTSLFQGFTTIRESYNTAQTAALENQMNADEAVLNSDQSNLNQATNTLNAANSNLSNANANLTAAESSLTEAELNLQNALFKLTELGCPSISNVIQVNLPWLPEYIEPYNLIPTTPPLITMGYFTYSNSGNIGYTNSFTRAHVGNNSGCDALNSTLTPPPYDIINIENNQYVGGSPIMTLQNSNIELCKASCYSTANCTGATFNSQTNSCSLTSGAGTLQPSQTTGTTALIPQITQYLLILSQLNFKLTTINEQIINLSKKSESTFIDYTNDNTIDHKLLQNRYKKLLAENKKIDQMINYIEQSQNEESFTSENTNFTYFKYALIAALAIIIFVILAMINKNNENIVNSDQNFQTSLFVIIFIIVIIVIGVLILNSFVKGTPIY